MMLLRISDPVSISCGRSTGRPIFERSLSMKNYSDCVLMCRSKYTGKPVRCYGLIKMLCLEEGKCPFYGSSKTLYRDQYGHVKVKGVQ